MLIRFLLHCLFLGATRFVVDYTHWPVIIQPHHCRSLVFFIPQDPQASKIIHSVNSSMLTGNLACVDTINDAMFSCYSNRNLGSRMTLFLGVSIVTFPICHATNVRAVKAVEDALVHIASAVWPPSQAIGSTPCLIFLYCVILWSFHSLTNVRINVSLATTATLRDSPSWKLDQ